MQSSLIRIQELAIQGANDTNGPQDREALATEIEGLVDHMMGLANTQDVSGNYVFAGSDSKTRPYERIDGDIVYQGDDVTSQIFVSEQQMLNLNRPGSKMFPPIAHATDAGDDNKRSFFGALGDLVSSMRGNDYDGIHQGMSDVTDMIDAVSKSLATVGTDLTVVESRKEVLNDVKLRYQTLLSDAQDLDYSKAITDLSAEMLTLEAAQSAFAKISGQSLFDYIR
jgi:Flagellin and related hook-associated proteins